MHKSEREAPVNDGLETKWYRPSSTKTTLSDSPDDDGVSVAGVEGQGARTRATQGNDISRTPRKKVEEPERITLVRHRGATQK